MIQSRGDDRRILYKSQVPESTCWPPNGKLTHKQTSVGRRGVGSAAVHSPISYMTTRRAVLRSLLGLASSGCAWSASRVPDVCIVGTGPGGAILATELSRHGISCLLVEGGRGDRVERDYEPGEYPLETTRYQGLGGTSNLWGASCSRFHPRDFERGAWPLSYNEIEPYYFLAERELRVSGSASRHAPPRRDPYPVPVPDEYTSSLTYEVFSAGGIDIEWPPMAGNTKIVRSHLPGLRSSGRVSLMEQTRVRRVVCARDGHVTALEARGPGGEPLEIVAKCFVLACGGVETPRLLLVSRSARFPAGVGNNHDLVGRYFMEHPWAPVGRAKVPSRGLRLSEAPLEALTWEFYERLVEKGLGGAHVECLAGNPAGDVRVAALWEMAPQRDNRVALDADRRDAFGDPMARVEVTLSELDRRTQEELMSIAETIFARLGAKMVETEMVRPRWCHHHMGTCRMGADPRTSVVDPQLRVHGTDNLYLVGSSTFCSGGAGPPTLLLSALALRLAGHLRERLVR